MIENLNRQKVSAKLYGITPEGINVTEYTLTGKSGIGVKAINYGCTITSLLVPDRDGHLDDIVLGFNSLEGYLRSPHYIGSVIGRYANRIANGSFTIDGQVFNVANNVDPNHLHGGHKGFDKVVWNASEFQNEQGVGIDFHYLSPDGEEGFPGNLQLNIRYLLRDDDSLIISYTATTDKKTVLNFTQHSYFNLNGGLSDIRHHDLMINANQFLPIDHALIPTGEIRSVNLTPFDFSSAKSIVHDILVYDEQLQIAHGYDHNWVLNKNVKEPELAAILYDPSTGRALEILTTEPGIQLYTGNFLDDAVPGKNNASYGPHSGLCLETQHFPDSPHHPEFPSVILNPGEKFQSTTIWKFSVR
jgi:aldose 1-epimerase